jgi:hypothetical protein
MRLSVHEDGGVQIDLEPEDEQVIVNIGPANVWCFGGTRADPGTGLLIHVVLTDQAAKAVVDDHHVWVDDPCLEGPCSPRGESAEPYEP